MSAPGEAKGRRPRRCAHREAADAQNVARRSPFGEAA